MHELQRVLYWGAAPFAKIVERAAPGPTHRSEQFMSATP